MQIMNFKLNVHNEHVAYLLYFWIGCKYIYEPVCNSSFVYLNIAETRKKRHGMLKMYYGMEKETPGSPTIDPCDINGAHFDPDMFLSKLIKEKSLTELMDEEAKTVTQIRALDSDMQTLVYENYNKFISATDTIRKVSFIFNTFNSFTHPDNKC